MLSKTDPIKICPCEKNLEEDLKKIVSNLVPIYMLKFACEDGNLQLVKRIDCKGKVDLHCENEMAIKTACLYGHLPIVEYLVSKGVDIHVENDEILDLAYSKRHTSVVQFLLQKGLCFKKDCEDKVFIESIQEKNVEMCKILSKIVNKKSKIAGFHKACINGCTELVEYLGSQDDILLEEGNVGLQLATQYNQTSVVDYIKSK